MIVYHIFYCLYKKFYSFFMLEIQISCILFTIFFLKGGLLMINVLINGSQGSMGKVLKKCIDKTPDMFAKYKIDRNTPLSFETLSTNSDKPDVIIDFSTPEASFIALDYAVCHLTPIVIATTGFSDGDNAKIIEYSQAIPIFKASNMSYTIHLIGKVLTDIAPSLSYMDIEILEKHHSRKKDAPSGTALFLADCINSTCENNYQYVFDRHSSSSPRVNCEIGFSSIRGGNLVGEHSVLFLGENESIEIKHTAYCRDVYADGAIRAARFIIEQKHGLYGMEDLL